jgi:hypothetical protein
MLQNGVFSVTRTDEPEVTPTEQHLGVWSTWRISALILVSGLRKLALLMEQLLKFLFIFNQETKYHLTERPIVSPYWIEGRQKGLDAL